MKGIFIILLYLSMHVGLMGSSLVSHGFDESIDTISNRILLEQLLREQEAGGVDDSYGWPPIWDVPNISGGNVHGIIVMLEANTRINDVPLNPGDYVGGFYTDDYGELKCGGGYYLIEGENIIFSLFIDDPDTPEKDGFSYAETIYFKLFSWTTLKEYDIDVINFDVSGLYKSTNKWYPLGISQIVNLQALVDMDFYINADGNPICIGNQLHLIGEEFIGSGGTYVFNWTSDPPGFTSNLQIPPPTTPNETTTYFLTVEDGVLSSDHQVTVTVNDLPQAFAGSNGSVCGNETFSLTGTAMYYENTIWASSGDGSFEDPYALNTGYSPGVQDIQNGVATITLIAHPLNPCIANATDEIQLQVLPLPIVEPGGDMSACGNDAIILNAGGQYYSAVEWTTSGDGVFSNPNSATTQYSPGPDDLADGEAVLTVCASALSPCVFGTCDDIVISYLYGPSCSASPSTTKCENVPIPLQGSASNNSAVLWTTEGDGYFSNPSLVNTQYFAGPEDKENDGTTVTLNALPLAPCTVPASTDVVITLKHIPDVYAGNTNTVCKDSYLQLNATLGYASNFLWQTLGDGSFSSTNSLTAKYYPGPGDIQSGAFELILLAPQQYPCFTSVSDTLLVDVVDNPSVEINTLNNQVVCQSPPFGVSALAQYFGEVSWETNGDGSFINPGMLNTSYLPGPSDILSGQPVTLTIAVSPIAPCEIPDVALINVTFSPNPAANAGGNATICENNVLQLQGSAQHFSGVLWQSDGDGIFSDEALLDSEYTPGPDDINTGTVTLTLIASAINPCSVSDSDEVTISIQLEPVINAGNNAAVCETGTHYLGGVVAQNYGQLSWTTSGNGTFNNPNVKNPIYTPGSLDKINGSATLTLTGSAINPCTVYKADEKVLTVIKTPFADAGAEGDICETDTYQLNGNAENYSSLSWETDGDGSFSNSSILDPGYTPGPDDINAGTVTLTLIASAINPCSVNDSDEVTINIQLEPVINAGNNAAVCETGTHQLVGVIAQNYGQLSWTTSGNGTFNNPNVKNPIYTPGSQDKLNGSATLTLTGSAINPCTVYKADEKVLTVISNPYADAGVEGDVCETGTYQLNGDAENYSSLSWETDGDGSFSNSSILDPGYTPGSDDINAGTVTLTLVASAINPCSLNDSDEVTINIQLEPVINAGNNAAVCETGTHYLGGVVAQNYGQLTWTTSGNGTFNNPSVMNPTYTPGSQDKLDGSATLTLTGSAINPCLVFKADEKVLTVIKTPFADAGAEGDVCETGTYQLNGNAENYSSLSWETNGDGSFSNSSILNPGYTPGSDDINAGTVTLTLVASAINPCSVNDSDEVTINIQAGPLANAGNDITACGETQLSGSASNSFGVLWTTGGDGSFNNPSIQNPEYSPGPQDIANLSVVLTISAQPLSPCSVSATDNMTYSIDIPQIVSDGVVDQEIFAGNSLQLEFDAQSVTSGDYKWYFDGELIDNQNSYLLNINNLIRDNAGYYQGVYANNCGEVESNIALVQVLENSIHQNVVPQGWSGISSYVMPNEPAIENVFSDVSDNLVILSDNVGFYWPAQNINTLSNWSVTTGYKIKMENSAGLYIDGYIRYPSQELTIPSGWSYLPVNAICAFDVAGVFAGFPNITMIKDMAQTGIYWPDFNINTLQMLYPGNAYHILNNGGPVTFRYPKCDLPNMDLKEERVEVQSPWNDIIKTPSTHIFGLDAAVLSLFESGDIIGAYTSGGYCAGILAVDHQAVSQVLVAFANDPLSEAIEGFEAGEIVSFKVYKSSTNEELMMDVTYAPRSENAGLFENNGVSIIERFEFKTSSLNEVSNDDILLSIFPNPSSGKVNVNLMSKHQIDGNLSVLNINGQLMLDSDFDKLSSANSLSIDLSDLARGIYYLRITSDQFTKTQKIILE